MKANSQMYAVDSLRTKTTKDMDIDKIEQAAKDHAKYEDGTTNQSSIYAFKKGVEWVLASESNDIQNVSETKQCPRCVGRLLDHVCNNCGCKW